MSWKVFTGFVVHNCTVHWAKIKCMFHFSHTWFIFKLQRRECIFFWYITWYINIKYYCMCVVFLYEYLMYEWPSYLVWWLFVRSCKPLPFLALCSESTAPFLVPLPNPHCPIFLPFPPTHVNIANTNDINTPKSSLVGHISEEEKSRINSCQPIGKKESHLAYLLSLHILGIFYPLHEAMQRC